MCKRLGSAKLLSMAQKTRSYLLVEERLGRPLDEYVAEKRAEKASWVTICHDIAQTTDVRLTPETLRVWFSGHEFAEVAS